MNIAMDHYESRKSLTSLVTVAIIHLALLAGLLYGLKTVSVNLPREKDIVVRTLPPDQPQHQETAAPEIPFRPLILIPPVIPAPPVTVEIHDPAIDDQGSGKGKTGQPGSAGGAGAAGSGKVADVFIAAVVDARSCAKPPYPPNALRNGDTGVVTLELLVGVDGKVTDSKVAQSSGHRDLDRAAIAGLSLCKFKPATLNGQAQKSWAKLQYGWTIEAEN